MVCPQFFHTSQTRATSRDSSVPLLPWPACLQAGYRRSAIPAAKSSASPDNFPSTIPSKKAKHGLTDISVVKTGVLVNSKEQDCYSEGFRHPPVIVPATFLLYSSVMPMAFEYARGTVPDHTEYPVFPGQRVLIMTLAC